MGFELGVRRRVWGGVCVLLRCDLEIFRAGVRTHGHCLASAGKTKRARTLARSVLENHRERPAHRDNDD